MKTIVTTLMLVSVIASPRVAASDHYETATRSALGVFGAVSTSSCVPTVEGQVDLGDIPHGMLDPDRVTTLSDRSVSLSVVCDQAAKIALIPIDETRAGLPLGLHSDGYSKGWFMLSNASGARALGSLAVSIGSATLDGSPGTRLVWLGDGRFREGYDDLMVSPNQPVAFKLSSVPASEPTASKVLAAKVFLSPRIFPGKLIDSGDLVSVRGAMTFELLIL